MRGLLIGIAKGGTELIQAGEIHRFFRGGGRRIGAEEIAQI
jgi:hypothetical protein